MDRHARAQAMNAGGMFLAIIVGPAIVIGADQVWGLLASLGGLSLMAAAYYVGVRQRRPQPFKMDTSPVLRFEDIERVFGNRGAD